MQYKQKLTREKETFQGMSTCKCPIGSKNKKREKYLGKQEDKKDVVRQALMGYVMTSVIFQDKWKITDIWTFFFGGGGGDGECVGMSDMIIIMQW